RFRRQAKWWAIRDDCGPEIRFTQRVESRPVGKKLQAREETRRCRSPITSLVIGICRWKPRPLNANLFASAVRGSRLSQTLAGLAGILGAGEFGHNIAKRSGGFLG